MKDKCSYGQYILDNIVDPLGIDTIPIIIIEPIKIDNNVEISKNIIGVNCIKNSAIPFECNYCGNNLGRIELEVLDYYVNNNIPFCSNCNTIPSEVSNNNDFKNKNYMTLNDYKDLVKTKEETIKNRKNTIDTEENMENNDNKEILDKDQNEEIVEETNINKKDENEEVQTPVESLIDNENTELNKEQNTINENDDKEITIDEIIEIDNLDESLDENEEIIEETTEDINEEIIEETTEDINEETTEDINEEIIEETTEDINEETTEDINEEIIEENKGKEDYYAFYINKIIKDNKKEIVDFNSASDDDLFNEQDEDQNINKEEIIAEDVEFNDESDENINDELNEEEVFDEKQNELNKNKTIEFLHNSILERIEQINLSQEFKIRVIVEKTYDKNNNVIENGIDGLRFTCIECGSTFKINVPKNHEFDLNLIMDSLCIDVNVGEENSNFKQRKILNCKKCRMNYISYKNIDNNNFGYFNKQLQYSLNLYVLFENNIHFKNKNIEKVLVLDESYLNLNSIYDKITLYSYDINTKNLIDVENIRLIDYIEIYKNYNFNKEIFSMSQTLKNLGWKEMLDYRYFKKIDEKSVHFNNIDLNVGIYFNNKRLINDIKLENTEDSNFDSDRIFNSYTEHTRNSDFYDDELENKDIKLNQIIHSLEQIDDVALKLNIFGDFNYNEQKIFNKTFELKHKSDNPFYNPNEIEHRFNEGPFKKIIDYATNNAELRFRADKRKTNDIPVIDTIVGGKAIRILCVDLKDSHSLYVPIDFERSIPYSYSKNTSKEKLKYERVLLYSDSVEHNSIGTTLTLKKIFNPIIDKKKNIILDDKKFPLFYTVDSSTFMSFCRNNSPNGSQYTKVSSGIGGSVTIMAAILLGNDTINTNETYKLIKGMIFGDTNENERDKDSILKEAGLEPACGFKYYKLINPNKKSISYFITDYVERSTVNIVDGLESCISVLLKEHYTSKDPNIIGLTPFIYIEHDKSSFPSISFEFNLFNKSKFINLMGNINGMNQFFRNSYYNQLNLLGVNTNNFSVIKNPASTNTLSTDKFRYDSRIFSSKRTMLKLFGNILSKNSPINPNDSDYNFIKNAMEYLDYVKVTDKDKIITFIANGETVYKRISKMNLFNKLEWKDKDFIMNSDSRIKLKNVISTNKLQSILQQKNVLNSGIIEKVINEELYKRQFEQVINRLRS